MVDSSNRGLGEVHEMSQRGSSVASPSVDKFHYKAFPSLRDTHSLLPFRSGKLTRTKRRKETSRHIILGVSLSLREFRPALFLRFHLSVEDRWRGGVRLSERAAASGLDQRPDFLGLERHVNACDPQRSESIQYGVDYSGWRGNRSRFTHAFRTQ